MSLTITTTTSSLPIGEGQSVTIYLHDAQPGFTGTRHAELFIEVTPSGDFHVAKSPTLYIENMESYPPEEDIRVITRPLDAGTLPDGTAYVYDYGDECEEIDIPRYRVDVAGVAVFAWMEDIEKAKAYARYLRDSRRELLTTTAGASVT